ncbi:serine hydrolase, partial [Klebsiella pneumoniae]|uniref:serine hydrolase n=1 Tax=Klebsiella pneumoniae TaxID=573 RepID=UPI003EE0E02C
DGATLFHIGSVTKAFLATTAAIAVDDGVLGWNDPVIGRYPAFRLSDPAIAAQVTIPDILAHVVGLPGHALEDMAPMGYS